MSASKINLQHAITQAFCNDPDCEIHFPEVIETDSKKLTALAWYYAGACSAVDIWLQVPNPVPSTVLRQLRKEHQIDIPPLEQA